MSPNSDETPDPELLRRLQRVVVSGTTSSGKSTVAQQLSGILGSEFVELDALHWEPNWTKAPLEVFRQRVERAVEPDRWVVAGNYSIVRDIIWPKATAIIWLDYPLRLILWRLLVRTLKRVITKEDLWGTNRERWTNLIPVGDSLFVWALKTHGSRQRTFPIAFEQPEYAHIDVVHHYSPKTTRQWLSEVEKLARRQDPNQTESKLNKKLRGDR